MSDSSEDCSPYETPRSNLHRRRPASFEYASHGSPDSGYGSGEEPLDSSSPSIKTRRRYCHGLDGEGAWPASSIVPAVQTSVRPGQPITRAVSLPAKRTTEQRAAQDAVDNSSMQTDSPASLIRRSKGRIPHSPNRFVPFRYEASSAERYQTTKQPTTLSKSEKIIRRDFILQDPFMATARRRPSISSSMLPLRHPNSKFQYATPAAFRPQLTKGKVPLRGRDSRRLPERQVSHGTVWSVGGLAPRTVTSTGTHSGANASRMNTQPIVRPPLTAVQNAKEELENYQGRVAMALGIDRVRRTLDFTKMQSPRCCRRLLNSQSSHGANDRSWVESNWSITKSPTSL